MSKNITVTFIGTTSGGGPTETRNCSSLVVDPFGNGSLWMVDCAEGTVRQFEQQPYKLGQTRLRAGQVSKVFITHMHADHTMGTLTLLRNVLGIPKPPGQISTNAAPPNAKRPRVEIFGPRGIRRMLRTLWYITHTHSEFSYVVHELLFPGEQPSVPADVPAGHGEDDGASDEADVRRESECVGKDIWCDEEGFWRGIVDVSPYEARNLWGATVDAGPIEHRDPCIGYIIREVPRHPLTSTSALPRKLVILGDTYDPSPLLPLIQNDPPFASPLPYVEPYDNGVRVRIPVTLLVHEATDAYLPPSVDPQQRTGRNRTSASVAEKAIMRGHSTPAMAGAFARVAAAERLVLNHIGARFPAPEMDHFHDHDHRHRHVHTSSEGGRNKFRLQCMREIERQAAEAWNSKKRMHPQAAWDFLSIALPPNQEREPASGPSRIGMIGAEEEVEMEVEVEVVKVDVEVKRDVAVATSAAAVSESIKLTEENASRIEGGRDHHSSRKRKEPSGSSSHGMSRDASWRRGGGGNGPDSRRGYHNRGRSDREDRRLRKGREDRDRDRR